MLVLIRVLSCWNVMLVLSLTLIHRLWKWFQKRLLDALIKMVFCRVWQLQRSAFLCAIFNCRWKNRQELPHSGFRFPKKQINFECDRDNCVHLHCVPTILLVFLCFVPAIHLRQVEWSSGFGVLCFQAILQDLSKRHGGHLPAPLVATCSNNTLGIEIQFWVHFGWRPISI